MKFMWLLGNLYGKLFGWRWLAPVHHAIVNLSLHALGYGNLHLNGSGESWFVKRVLAPTNPKVILDIGANIGAYSQELLAETEARIYAVEPNPAAFKKLQSLPERVTPIQCAVSREPGEATLHFKSEFDEQASLEPIKATSGSVTVPVTTIAALAQEQQLTDIDFIKIDTEGFELEVLSGLGAVRPQFVQFEFNINHVHRDVTLLQIARLLPNYTLYRLLPNGWLKVDPKKYLNNIFMFSNYVAVRNDVSL